MAPMSCHRPSTWWLFLAHLPWSASKCPELTFPCHRQCDPYHEKSFPHLASRRRAEAIGRGSLPKFDASAYFLHRRRRNSVLWAHSYPDSLPVRRNHPEFDQPVLAQPELQGRYQTHSSCQPKNQIAAPRALRTTKGLQTPLMAPAAASDRSIPRGESRKLAILAFCRLIMEFSSDVSPRLFDVNQGTGSRVRLIADSTNFLRRSITTMMRHFRNLIRF